MPRQSFNLSMPGFVADHHSIDLLGTGGQIGWDAVAAGPDGKKVLPAGKALSRRAADGKLIPRAGLAANPAIGFLATNASEELQATGHHAKSGYGVIIGGALYETLMPDSGHADWGAIKTEVKSAGTGFVFQAYADSRAS